MLVALPFYCSVLVEFLQLLYKTYSDLYFTYLEINPLGEEYICMSGD